MLFHMTIFLHVLQLRSVIILPSVFPAANTKSFSIGKALGIPDNI